MIKNCKIRIALYFLALRVESLFVMIALYCGIRLLIGTQKKIYKNSKELFLDKKRTLDDVRNKYEEKLHHQLHGNVCFFNTLLLKEWVNIFYLHQHTNNQMQIVGMQTVEEILQYLRIGFHIIWNK